MLKQCYKLLRLGLLLGGITACGNHNVDFTVVNESNNDIASGSVTLLTNGNAALAQTMQLAAIQVGDTVSGSFTLAAESHYHIQIQFESGEKITKDTGYITPGFDYHHKITVTANDVLLTNAEEIRQRDCILF